MSLKPKDVIKEYSNGNVTIIWNSSKCIHSGKCVKNLPGVFKPKEKPWIQIENGTDAELISAVSKCPSGAISIK